MQPMLPTQPFAIPDFIPSSLVHNHHNSVAASCYNKEAIKQKQINCDSPRTMKEQEAEEENLNFSLFPSSLLCRLYCGTCRIIETHYVAESGTEKMWRKKKLEFDC